MSNYQNRPGTGVLFQNDKKTGERQPDYKGKFVCDRDYKAGEEFKISAWKKKTVKNYLIAISVDNYKAGNAQAWPRPDHDDNEVPF
jgi:hypothetical protein